MGSHGPYSAILYSKAGKQATGNRREEVIVTALSGQSENKMDRDININKKNKMFKKNYYKNKESKLSVTNNRLYVIYGRKHNPLKKIKTRPYQAQKLIAACWI